jgi:hypothetical protein
VEVVKTKTKAKTKKVKPVVKPKVKRDPRIEDIYYEDVTFTCLVRGQVTQRVKIKRFKPLAEQASKHLIVTIGDLVDKLEEQDDGLAIYSDGEELSISPGPTEDPE